jgi:hypothetical protein
MRPDPISLDLKAQPVTVPVAAYAAGVSPRAMRGWLENDAVNLMLPRRASGAWLRVAPVDVVRLAALGHMVQGGFTIAEANAVLLDCVDRHIEAVVMVGGGAPWFLIESRFRGLTLQISREPDGMAVSIETMFGHRPARHSAAVLSINIGHLASQARRRVRDKTGAAE